MKRIIIALTLVAALIGLGASAVPAGQQRPSEPVWSHVVRQGETLWQLARQAAPQRDTRETVDRLVATNHLRGGLIVPGQRLVLRAR